MASGLSAELLSSLDVALNEADFCDFAVTPDQNEATVLLRVLTLPDVGPEPDDRRLLLRLRGVGRVAVSLRAGRWDDAAAAVQSLSLSALQEAVRSFECQPIYGWEFFDVPSWGSESRLSLDLQLPGGAHEHSLALFQEAPGGPDRFLDLKVWFGDLAAYSYDGQPVNLEDVAAGGKRWWDAFNRRDRRTLGHGMVPGANRPSSAP